MKTISNVLCALLIFIVIPVWAGYTGDNMHMWSLVTVLLSLLAIISGLYGGIIEIRLNKIRSK